MDRVGKVVDTKEGLASLEVRKVSSCGTHCASCSAACEQPPQVIEVINTLDAKAGDFVEIQADSGRVLKYMLLLYGIPLLFLIVGFGVGHSYLVGQNINNYEILSLLIGLIAFAFGGLIVRLIDKRSNVKSENVNFMTRKL